jgi:predicted ATP-dependent protease
LEPGGLSNKILGSIKSSVKSFIYPKENQRDFDDFMKKYKDNDDLKNVSFYPIENVNEALELLLDKKPAI